MSKKERPYKLHHILDEMRDDARGDSLKLAAIDSTEETLTKTGIDICEVRSVAHWKDDCRLVAALVNQWDIVATPELKRKIIRDRKRNALIGAFMDTMSLVG